MNQHTLSITDETSSGKLLQQDYLYFEQEKVTTRQIIQARVTHEVNLYNSSLPDYFKGLIEPTDAEKTINGFKMQGKKKIDAEKQVYVALQAFQQNGFFVLINNIQSSSLEDVVTITPNTRISFIKLTPLVGG